MAMAPAGTGKGWPTSGKVRAASPIARDNKATAGRAGSSASACVRTVATRNTPGACAAACTNSGVK